MDGLKRQSTINDTQKMAVRGGHLGALRGLGRQRGGGAQALLPLPAQPPTATVQSSACACTHVPAAAPCPQDLAQGIYDRMVEEGRLADMSERDLRRVAEREAQREAKRMDKEKE